jgi:hypothetical protein
VAQNAGPFKKRPQNAAVREFSKKAWVYGASLEKRLFARFT